MARVLAVGTLLLHQPPYYPAVSPRIEYFHGEYVGSWQDVTLRDTERIERFHQSNKKHQV